MSMDKFSQTNDDNKKKVQEMMKETLRMTFGLCTVRMPSSEKYSTFDNQICTHAMINWPAFFLIISKG